MFVRVVFVLCQALSVFAFFETTLARVSAGTWHPETLTGGLLSEQDIH